MDKTERMSIPTQYPQTYMLEVGGASIDIRPLFFVALAVGENDKSIIRKKYEEKKWLYFEAYRKSKYSKDPLLTCYPIEAEENIRMLIGIYEISEQTGNFDVLLAIIKNQYKDLYRYVESRHLFDEVKFIEYLKKKNKNKFPEVRKFIYSLYVAMFLCHTFKKNFSLVLSTTESMMGLMNTPNTPEKREKEWEGNYRHVHQQVKQLSDFHFLPIPKENFRLWEYIGNQMHEVDTEMQRGVEVDKLRIANIQTRLNAFVAFGDIIESFGIDPIELQNVELEPAEIRRLIQEFTLHLEEHSETDIDFNVFFSVYYYMRRLALMYQDAKIRLLDTSEEEKFVFAMTKEQEIKEREEKLAKVEQEAKNRSKQQKEKNEALQKELLAMQKREKAWEKEREEQEKNKKELYALRSFLYRHEENAEVEDVVLEEDQLQHMLETVQRKRIVFFGGHPNWIQKTRDFFPEARFLEVDDINRKLSFIQNYDVVCINADYFNHGFYDKLMNEIAKYSAQLVYVRGATNQERLVKEIYEQLNA